jgi:hypothetical protein
LEAKYVFHGPVFELGVRKTTENIRKCTATTKAKNLVRHWVHPEKIFKNTFLLV